MTDTAIQLVAFDRTYLDRSWAWLNDPEIKRLTLAPDFSRAEQMAFFDSLPGRLDYRIWGVASATGQPIGAAGLKRILGDSAEAFLYIGEREWWRRGHGREILGKLDGEARALGLRALTMRTGIGNFASRRVFGKAGYVETACNGRIVEMRRSLTGERA